MGLLRTTIAAALAALSAPPPPEPVGHAQMSGHTPLPWRTDATGRHIQSNELHVASCESSSHDHAAIDRANAALIVRAVNGHGHLVRVLALTLPVLTVALEIAENGGEPEDVAAISAAIRDVEAALRVCRR